MVVHDRPQCAGRRHWLPGTTGCRGSTDHDLFGNRSRADFLLLKKTVPGHAENAGAGENGDGIALRFSDLICLLLCFLHDLGECRKGIPARHRMPPLSAAALHILLVLARFACNSRSVVVRKAVGQGTLINERLGRSVFESRECRSVNRCPPESNTGKELVYNTGIPGL